MAALVYYNIYIYIYNYIYIYIIIIYIYHFISTLWLFNIAMETGPFIDDFPS